jgi:DNA-binding HxlR family transcriptional regulator
MPSRSKAVDGAFSSTCAITRSLGVLSDTWTFLLLREALLGRRTFAEFEQNLGIGTAVLADRLAHLVDCGVMEKLPYRIPGQRVRHAYSLTPAGDELRIVLAALHQWGAEHLASSTPLARLPLDRVTHRRLRVALIDDQGQTVDSQAMEFFPESFATPG